MSACRTQMPRRSGSKWSNAVRTSACRCRRDAGWPGKRGAHCALAVPFRRSHNAPRPWPFAGGGSWSVSRPPGRRPSSCDQCGSTAATAPRRGRPQACRLTAVDQLLPNILPGGGRPLSLIERDRTSPRHPFAFQHASAAPSASRCRGWACGRRDGARATAASSSGHCRDPSRSRCKWMRSRSNASSCSHRSAHGIYANTTRSEICAPQA